MHAVVLKSLFRQVGSLDTVMATTHTPHVSTHSTRNM